MIEEQWCVYKPSLAHLVIMNKDTGDANVTKRPQNEDTTRQTESEDRDTKAQKTTTKTNTTVKTSKPKAPATDSMMTTVGLLGALLLIFGLYYLFGSTTKSAKEALLNEETLINKFNSKKSHYTMKVNNFFADMSLHHVSELFKASLGDLTSHPSCDSFKLQDVVVPTAYNFYDQHPNCKFSEIQQRTATGYVEVLASTFRNRYCTLHLGKDFSPSVQHLISCDLNKNGVKAGKMSKLLDYVKSKGFVSEKEYSRIKKPEAGCVPEEELNKLTRADVANVCKLKDEKYIKREIFMNGPVISTMDLYQNFLLYEKGLYTIDKSRKLEGQIFVKIIGWGVEEKKKTEYWLVETTFGKNWGEAGVAKVMMHMKGSNLAETAIAVYPKIPEVKAETKTKTESK